MPAAIKIIICNLNYSNNTILIIKLYLPRAAPKIKNMTGKKKAQYKTLLDALASNTASRVNVELCS